MRQSLNRCSRLASIAVGLVALLVGSASAASYPTKSIRIVVPYPAGGTSDILARIVGNELSKRLGQPIAVDNRSGGGGNIGARMVASSAPDGYTLLLGTINTHGINASLFKTLPFDAVRDFAPITVIATTPNVLSVNPAVPAANLQELLALVRAKPGTYNFGSTSIGGSPHMSGELLKMMANVDIVHVPYRGGAPMLTDLIGGQIQMGFDNLPSSMGHIRAGTIRPIAVTTATRWSGAPEIPTMGESGLSGYEVAAWFGLLAPAKTPREIVDLLQKNVAEILNEEPIKKQFFELGAEPVGNTPDQFADLIRAEVKKWAKVVAVTGVAVE